MVAVDNVLLSFTTATLLAVHVVELVRLPVNVALEANNADAVTVPGNEVLPDASSRVAV